MATLHTSSGGYVLGHSEFELKRLARQAEMMAPITRRYFQAAGIGPGMRVLDVGSGAGDVAFLLAELVGPSGTVVGFDRVPAALETARRRAQEKGLDNVTFVEGDAESLDFSEAFDAIAGRYILMFQADPAAFLRPLLRWGRPGAPVVFHEVDWRGFRSIPRVASFEACCRWMIDTMVATGTDHEMGLKMHATFERAGLPAPTLGIDAQAGGGPAAEELIELVADLAISVSGAILECGAATAEEMDVETLHERIRAEAAQKDAVLMGRFEMGAWSRME